MPSLLEIESIIRSLLFAHEDALSQTEDEQEIAGLEENLAKTLAELAQTEAEKIDAYGVTISRIEAEAKRHGETIKSLQIRKQVLLNRVERIKNHVMNTFEFYDRKKIEGSVYIAKTRKYKSIEIEKESLVPRKFMRITFEPDLKAIKEAIEQNKKVRGAALVEKTSISIGTK